MSLMTQSMFNSDVDSRSRHNGYFSVKNASSNIQSSNSSKVLMVVN